MAGNNKMFCKKTKFATEAFALIELKNIQKRSKRKVVPVRAYLCKYCELWHLTSQPSTFALQEENTLLRNAITELEKRVYENKTPTTQEKRLARIETRKEERYVLLLKKLKFQNAVIKKLRKENRNLIQRLVDK